MSCLNVRHCTQGLGWVASMSATVSRVWDEVPQCPPQYTSFGMSCLNVRHCTQGLGWVTSMSAAILRVWDELPQCLPLYPGFEMSSLNVRYCTQGLGWATSMSATIPRVWDELPQYIKHCTLLAQFKMIMLEYLLGTCVSSQWYVCLVYMDFKVFIIFVVICIHLCNKLRASVGRYEHLGFFVFHCFNFHCYEYYPLWYVQN